MPTADCFAWESFDFDDSEVEPPPPPLLPTSARQPTKPSNTSTSRMRQPPPIKKIHRRLPPPVWGGAGGTPGAYSVRICPGSGSLGGGPLGISGSGVCAAPQLGQ